VASPIPPRVMRARDAMAAAAQAPYNIGIVGIIGGRTRSVPGVSSACFANRAAPCSESASPCRRRGLILIGAGIADPPHSVRSRDDALNSSRQLIAPGVAAVIHQRDKRAAWSRPSRREGQNSPGGAVDDSVARSLSAAPRRFRSGPAPTTSRAWRGRALSQLTHPPSSAAASR